MRFIFLILSLCVLSTTGSAHEASFGLKLGKKWLGAGLTQPILAQQRHQWQAEYPDPNKASFYLRHSESGLYLTAAAEALALLPSRSEDGLWQMQHLRKGRALINHNGLSLALEQGYLLLSAQAAELVLSPDFTPVYLSTTDIKANNCLLRFSDGMALNTLFIKSVPGQTISTGYAIELRGRGSDTFSFAPNLGFDPIDSQACDSQCQQIMTSLAAQIESLPAVQELNLSPDAVLAYLATQLSDSYRAGNQQGALLWLTPVQGTTPGLSESQLKVKINDNPVLGQQLLLNFTTYGEQQTHRSFAFLLKKTAADGTVSYVLSDPSGSQNQGPIIKL